MIFNEQVRNDPWSRFDIGAFAPMSIFIAGPSAGTDLVEVAKIWKCTGKARNHLTLAQTFFILGYNLKLK